MTAKKLLLAISCLILLCGVYFYLILSTPSLEVFFKIATQPPKHVSSIIVYEKSIKHERLDYNCQTLPKLQYITILQNNQIWQQLNNHSKLFLYSAFLDTRLGNNSRFVRILGMSKGKYENKLYCRVWYGNLSVVHHLDNQEIWNFSWDYAMKNRYYRPLLLSCPIIEDITPTAVSIVDEPCTVPNNVLRLKPVKGQKKKEFAICLKPLYFEKDISARLLEWLELQFILGADKVQLYVYKLHPQTLKVLQYYENLGKVSIKNHTIPDKQPFDYKNVIKNTWQKRRYEIIPYNDCFYSHQDTHNYVILLDIDEAIIPVIHDSWSSLLSQAFPEKPNVFNRTSSFSVSNVYFFDTFGEVADTTIPKFMHMLRHVYRSSNFTPPGFAMKSFFLTNNTLTVFNHYALCVLRSYQISNLPLSKKLVQLHHYRASCPPLMKAACKTNFMKYKTKDTIIFKFKDLLIKKVEQVMSRNNLTFN